MKIKGYIAGIFVTLLASIFCLSGCFLLPISDKKRAEIYAYFNDDSNYMLICGTLIRYYSSSDGGNACWVLKLDDEFIAENQELCNKYFPRYFTGGMQLTDKTNEVLRENGFYDLLLDESEIDKSVEYPALIKETIFVVISCDTPEYWIACPVVEVRVGDTVYLDYETGKANFLDYIQNDLR